MQIPMHFVTALLSRRHITRPLTEGSNTNPPHGGPADTDVTDWIEARANTLMEQELIDVKKLTLDDALNSDHVVEYRLCIPVCR